MHNVEDLVYFTVIVDEVLYAVKYKIIEKIEAIEGFSYVVDVLEEQDEPEVAQLVRQKRVGNNFRVCGDSLFQNKEDARQKARKYFQDMLARMA